MANNRELSQFANTIGYNGGNVGIGTDNPGDKLSIYTAPNALVFGAKDTTRSNHIFQLLANNPAGDGELRLYKSSATGTHEKTVEIKSTGNSYFTGGSVGIGTNNPAYKLSIYGTGAVRNEIVCTDNNGAGAGVYFRTMNGGSMVSNATIRTDNAGNLQIFSGTSSDAERLRITSAGNVGINRADPDQKLNINGNLEVNAYDSASGSGGYYTAKGLIIGNAYDAGKTTTDDRNAIIWQERGLDLDIATNDTLRMKITYGGTLEVKGDANPNVVFDRGSANTTNVNFNYNGTLTGQLGAANSEFQISAAGSNTPLTIFTDGSERLRITSDGKVGVKNTSPDGVGIDVKADRTTNYSATTDQRSLAHIIARNGSDAANRFSSISLVNGGGTQAEASINLVQAGNYIGHLTFKMRSGASSWAERLRIFSSGVVKATKGFLTGGSNVAGMIELAASSGNTVIDTGISVNASNGGGAMMVLASRNTSDQTSTAAGMYLLDFRYNGNHVPGVTFIGGDNICTFNKTAGNNLSVTCSSGNWCVSAFFGGYGIGNQLT